MHENRYIFFTLKKLISHVDAFQLKLFFLKHPILFAHFCRKINYTKHKIKHWVYFCSRFDPSFVAYVLLYDFETKLLLVSLLMQWILRVPFYDFWSGIDEVETVFLILSFDT